MQIAFCVSYNEMLIWRGGKWVGVGSGLLGEEGRVENKE